MRYNLCLMILKHINTINKVSDKVNKHKTFLKMQRKYILLCYNLLCVCLVKCWIRLTHVNTVDKRISSTLSCNKACRYRISSGENLNPKITDSAGMMFPSQRGVWFTIVPFCI